MASQLKPRWLAEKREQVLIYVRVHPGCTNRDVTQDVLGGSGKSGSSKRQYSIRLLEGLKNEGLIQKRKIKKEIKRTQYMVTTYWPSNHDGKKGIGDEAQ